MADGQMDNILPNINNREDINKGREQVEGKVGQDNVSDISSCDLSGPEDGECESENEPIPEHSDNRRDIDYPTRRVGILGQFPSPCRDLPDGISCWNRSKPRSRYFGDIYQFSKTEPIPIYQGAYKERVNNHEEIKDGGQIPVGSPISSGSDDLLDESFHPGHYSGPKSSSGLPLDGSPIISEDELWSAGHGDEQQQRPFKNKVYEKNLTNTSSYLTNPIGALQERFQSKGITPQYRELRVVQGEAASHAPLFAFQVILSGLTANGSGRSKKQAKHAAALAMLTRLGGQVPAVDGKAQLSPIENQDRGKTPESKCTKSDDLPYSKLKKRKKKKEKKRRKPPQIPSKSSNHSPLSYSRDKLNKYEKNSRGDRISEGSNIQSLSSDSDNTLEDGRKASHKLRKSEHDRGRKKELSPDCIDLRSFSSDSDSALGGGHKVSSKRKKYRDHRGRNKESSPNDIHLRSINKDSDLGDDHKVSPKQKKSRTRRERNRDPSSDYRHFRSISTDSDRGRNRDESTALPPPFELKNHASLRKSVARKKNYTDLRNVSTDTDLEDGHKASRKRKNYSDRERNKEPISLGEKCHSNRDGQCRRPNYLRFKSTLLSEIIKNKRLRGKMDAILTSKANLKPGEGISASKKCPEAAQSRLSANDKNGREFMSKNQCENGGNCALDRGQPMAVTELETCLVRSAVLPDPLGGFEQNTDETESVPNRFLKLKIFAKSQHENDSNDDHDEGQTMAVVGFKTCGSPPTVLPSPSIEIKQDKEVSETEGQNYLEQCATVPQPVNVKLEKLPFYDVEAELLKPTILAQGSSRFQEAQLQFSLSPQQATAIASNRDISTGTKLNYLFQVQLRFCIFCPLDASAEQGDEFPSSICLHVNGTMCTLPNPIPSNKPNVEAKRPPRPVNITPLCKLAPTMINTINVKWVADFGNGWVVGVWMVEKLSHMDLVSRLQNKGMLSPEYTREAIKQQLNDDNADIATDHLKVTLSCPLGKVRMTYPCRPSTCSHLQCFDAALFLQMNERKPTWQCPVCDRPAIYDTLLMDGYFLELIKSKELPENQNNIILKSDGGWESCVLEETVEKKAEEIKTENDECTDLSTGDGGSLIAHRAATVAPF